MNLRDNINDHIWKVCMNMIHTIFHVNTIFNGDKGKLTSVDCILKCNSERHVCLLATYVVWHSFEPLSSVLRLALLIIVIRLANVALQMF